MFQLNFTKSAFREFAGLQKEVQKRFSKKFDDFESGVMPQDQTKLKGTKDIYRTRVGNYRAIYQISSTSQIITIIKIAHRKEVYR